MPKPKSKQGFTPQSSKLPYFNQLLFLKDNMTPRNTATNIPRDPIIPKLDDSADNNSELDLTDEDEHVEQNEDEDEEVGLNNIPNVQSTTPQYRKHSKRKSYQTEAIEIKQKKIKLFEERLKTKKNSNTDSDEDYHFLMSLLPSFKKMDSLKKMKVRMEVLSIITKTLESEKCPLAKVPVHLAIQIIRNSRNYCILKIMKNHLLFKITNIRTLIYK